MSESEGSWTIRNRTMASPGGSRMDLCKRCNGKEDLSFHRIHLVQVLGSKEEGREYVDCIRVTMNV
jgi:hypothetical protein